MAERRFYQGETFANYDPGELLQNAEFEDCVFDHCRWLGTRVQNCRFSACTFDHCNFSGVVFSFTTMKDAWLLNSAFRSMAWGGLQGKSGVFQPFGKIKNCAFRYNDFSGMALNGFDWTGAELQQCTFDDTRLAGASFYGVRLGGTRFTRCDLQKADLRTAEEYVIDLETNKLKGARFSFPDVVRLLDGTGIVMPGKGARDWLPWRGDSPRGGEMSRSDRGDGALFALDAKRPEGWLLTKNLTNNGI